MTTGPAWAGAAFARSFETALPRKSKNGAAAQPPKAGLPSRADVLDFIARERAATGAGGASAKIGKREIARAFGVTGANRIGLKLLLRDLELDGEVERRGKSLKKPGAMPPVVLADIKSRDRDGELIASPVEWEGEPPLIRIQPPRRHKPGDPVAGVGDRALLRVERAPGEVMHTGRVIKIIERVKLQILGVYRALPGGGGRVLPVDKKNRTREYTVAADDARGAGDGDLVAIELRRGARFGPPSARVSERLGSISSEKAISLIAIHIHNIPHVFSREALAESERAQAATMGGREDWRALALITIDPADAKDHDDAVHAAADTDAGNPGGFVLSVAIADVAAYARPGSPLDRDALERGNSVYFPDRVVPMLPERISNDLCSLKPLVDRPALAVRMTIGADGRKRGHSFHRVMMRSAAKLSYPQAQAAIDGQADEITRPLLAGALRPLWAAYAALNVERARRSPLDLELPERKLLLKPDGSIDRVIVPPRLDAHRLIEEFMILANVAAAETLEDKKQMLIYRAHDEPGAEKLGSLAEFLATIGIKMAKGEVIRPQGFNRILAQVKGGEHENIVNEVILRSQAQAEYTSRNHGHFGLALRRYAHFTSPIRRYADLIVHRALIRALRFGDDGLPDMAAEELADIAARISGAERRAMKAERETTERLIATFLADQVGATFQGRIGGVTRAGLFVRLDDTGADGFIPAATLGNDFFRYDEALRALIGSRSGETHRLGDRIEVRLAEAAPFAGALRFEMLSEGRRRRDVAGARSQPAGARRDNPPRGKTGGKGSSKRKR